MRVGQRTLATLSSSQKVVSLSRAESQYYSMVRCASEAIGLANTMRELGHEAHVRIWTDAAAARGAGSPQREGAIKHMDQELRIGNIRGTVNSADLMAKHLDEKRLVMLCDLLNIKHISAQPSSAPKQTLDTEYTSRTSRALAAITGKKRNRCAFWSRGSMNTEPTGG